MSDLDKIEAYLANLPPEKRAVLQDWHSRILKFIPDAVETFSYGMPMFKWRGKGVAAYAAGKNHFGYYPVSSNIIPALTMELTGLKTSKGAVQFTIAKPLTDALLAKLVHLRMDEINCEK